MSREQIEEMARDLENHTCMSQFQAEIASRMLYQLGYRKQSENVIELPCRVGDMVYCIEHNIIRECIVKMVKSLTYDENGTKYFVEAECEIESPFYSDGRKIKHGLSAVWEIEWGSWYRAFRTREEAEKELAERRARGNDRN